MAVKSPFELSDLGKLALANIEHELAESVKTQLAKHDARVVFTAMLRGVEQIGAKLIAAGAYAEEDVATQIAQALVGSLTIAVEPPAINDEIPDSSQPDTRLVVPS